MDKAIKKIINVFLFLFALVFLTHCKRDLNMVLSGSSSSPGDTVVESIASQKVIQDSDLVGLKTYDVTPIQGGAKIAFRTYNYDAEIKSGKQLIYIYTVATNELVQIGASNLNVKFNSDETKVVYIDGPNTDGAYELYSVNVDGSGRTKLSGTLVSGGSVVNSVYGFGVSQSGNRVAYLADKDTDGVTELYSVNLDGTGEVKLNTTLANATGFNASASYDQFLFTPDGTKVAYVAQQETNLVSELYIVNVDGSNRIKLNPALVSGGGVVPKWTSISGDGSKVIYVADQETDNVSEIFSVNVDGSSNTKLNGALVSGGDVLSVEAFSPDNTKVIYAADESVDGRKELYITGLDGSGQCKLNAAIATGRTVRYPKFSADSSKVIYSVDRAVATEYELDIVDNDCTNHTVLESLIAIPNTLEEYYSFLPSGKVIYRGDPADDGSYEIYTINSDGTGKLQISQAPNVATDTLDWFKVSPDGSKVLYSFNGGALNTELRIVDIDGTNTIQIFEAEESAPGFNFDEYYGFASNAGFYFANKYSGSASSVYGVNYVNVDGSNKRRISFPDLDNFQLSIISNGSKYVFVDDLDTAGDDELYISNSDGTGRIKISSVLTPVEDVVRVEVSDTLSKAAYKTSGNKLYTVNLDGTAPTRVDDSAVTSIYDVENMRLLDGASRLVYGTRDFYSVNLDGSGHATLSSGFVTQFEFTPDETKFVYQNNNLTPPRRLYSVDIDGTNSTELNTALVFGQNISDFAISEDGSKVVYYGDQEVEDEFNVYSVNVDGTGGVKLNGSIVSGGFGVGFRNFSEANNIVYYLSDEETSGLGELFKVDIDGNNRTKVPGALGIASITYNLFGCMVMGASGDGNQAIHCADPDGDGIHNLYTTNGDGSGYALASPLFAAGGSMYNDFEMSGDKNYVLSKVDVNGDGVDRLYISPVDGSGVEEFSVELGASEHVYKYKIDGQRVTYITYENGRMEIYQRTIGSQTTYKLSGSSPAGTSIGADFKTFENGKYVVYSSNRENPLQSTVYVAEVP